jgi:hypothetical protein
VKSERTNRQRFCLWMARISWVVGVCLAISSVSLFFGDKGPHGLFEYAYIAAAVFAASALIVGGFFYLFSREFPSSEPQSGRQISK